MEALLARVADLALPHGDWVILGSGPLWAHGILATPPRDLDILARGAAWHRACRLGRVERAARGDQVVRLADGLVEVFDGWAPMTWAVDDVIDRAEWLHGLPWARLEYVLEFKRALGRPKDLEHVLLLEAWLERR